MFKHVVPVALFGILFWLLIRKKYTYPVVSTSELRDTYDYIIVGAGSAGAVLAARLSEYAPDRNILLLEAGKAPNVDFWYSHIPAFVPYLQQTNLDWQYTTEAQLHSHRFMNGKRSTWPRGKVLGGTSVLNYMGYNRGDASDYDRWGDRNGCKGWMYENVLPYFKRLEAVAFHADRTHRGHDGTLTITKAPTTPLADALLRAAKAFGITTDKDYNTPDNHQGLHRLQSNIDEWGWRESTASHYLLPAMERPNLHVLTEAHVIKVLFNSSVSTPKANGVQFVSPDGRVHEVSCSNEVLLSAGTIGSAQLLMLSGVADVNDLKQFNISPIAHVPQVGRNLRDHVLTFVFATVNDSTALRNHKVDSTLLQVPILDNVWNIVRHLIRGTGPLSWQHVPLIGHETSGLLPAAYQSDLQYVFLMNDAFDKGEFAKLYGLESKAYSHIGELAANRSVFTAEFFLFQPRSVGEIRLKSADPLEPPLIQPNYFKDPLDMKMQIQGLKRVWQLLSAPELRQFDVKIIEKCEQYDSGTNALFECLAQTRACTGFHPMSTCSMGVDHTDSVVDNKLRVHNVAGLRVVDVSIVPDTIAANTNAVAMMIGEYAADIILHRKHHN